MPRRFPSPSRWRQQERKTSSSATSLGVASQVSDIWAARLRGDPSSVGTCGTAVGTAALVWLALNLLGQTNEIARLRMTSCCSGRSIEMLNREPDMNTRRDFLKGAGAETGIVFCSCGLQDAAWAQQGDGQRLPVMVNGKRIKTSDVHAHCRFREAVALMGDEASRVSSQTRGAQENFIVIEERLKGMDAQAIDMEVLSINPFWYRKDRDTAAQIVNVQNEKLAELCASPPSPRSPCNIQTWRCSNSRPQ